MVLVGWGVVQIEGGINLIHTPSPKQIKFTYPVMLTPPSTLLNQKL